MKKQDIQILLEKLNIELDEIQRVKFEEDSVLSLILNNNFDRVLYLDALKQELKHLLAYFDRAGCNEMEVPEGEKEAAKNYIASLIDEVGNKKLDQITVEDIQKVKAYQKYLRILDGDFNL